VVDSIIGRLRGLDSERTAITDAANWTLTRIESEYGGSAQGSGRRKQAARPLAVDPGILSAMGRLASQNDPCICPHCGDRRAWPLPDGRRSCGGCGRRISATAGTIVHRTRTPLTVWFATTWPVTSQKHGVSALYLERVLGLGSSQTAWTMLHRFPVVIGGHR
jgi:hypothetical protein